MFSAFLSSRKPRKRVCVLGAGASGLAAIDQLLEKGFEVVCFESRPGVGGAWRVEEPGECEVRWDARGMPVATSKGAGASEDVPPTPMYPGVVTNIPQMLMEYKDVPFPPGTELFPSPDVVQSYIEQFSKPFTRHISLSTRVLNIRWTADHDAPSSLAAPSTGRRRWEVEFCSASNQVEKEEFDFVVVANGHYSVPHIPFVRGMARWKGRVVHSRWYRGPEPFAESSVLVVGASASGFDVVREIATLLHSNGSTRLVHQSVRSAPPMNEPFDAPGGPAWKRGIRVHKEIESLDPETGKVVFVDGEELEGIDTIIFATGYLWSYPFASPNDLPFSRHRLTFDVPAHPSAIDNLASIPASSLLPSSAPVHRGGLRLHHLDERQIFYLPDPTLGFLGVKVMVIPFPLAQLEARLLATHWAGIHQLELKVGVAEDAPESRHAHVYGMPREFEETDKWLEEIGEGVDGVDGKWPKRSPRAWELRTGGKELRRSTLGY